MECKTCFKPCDTTSGYCSIACMSTSLGTNNNLHTCNPTERAFLDEIREKGELDGFSFSGKRWIKIKGSQETVIYPDDFNTPLEELVNDTKTKAD